MIDDENFDEAISTSFFCLPLLYCPRFSRIAMINKLCIRPAEEGSCRLSKEKVSRSGRHSADRILSNNSQRKDPQR